jgi:hypothetical protein
MANAPSWFTQLKWSVPIPSRPLTAVRAVIPDITGCYAFTTRGFEPPLPPWQSDKHGLAAARSNQMRSTREQY